MGGVLIALPSGIGVAVSVMSENVASLVGVAISASLLPPAVNLGIYLGLAMALDDFTRDEAIAGMYSFLLTIENISIIYFTSLGVLYLKRFVVKSKSERQFWDYIDKRMISENRKKKNYMYKGKKRKAMTSSDYNQNEQNFQRSVYETFNDSSRSRNSLQSPRPFHINKNVSMDDIAENVFSKRMNSTPKDVFGSFGSWRQSMGNLFDEPVQTLYKQKTGHMFSDVRTDSLHKNTPKRVGVEDIFSEAEMGSPPNSLTRHTEQARASTLVVPPRGQKHKLTSSSRVIPASE